MTTTHRYLAYPALATGISITSSATAWTWTTWNEVVPASTITSEFHIAGATAIINANVGILDVRYGFNLSLGKGAASSETEIIQFSTTLFPDSNIGHYHGMYMTLPDAVTVAANTRIAARIAYAEAVAKAFTGIKILYRIV
jgi:hypothetical protein